MKALRNRSQTEFEIKPKKETDNQPPANDPQQPNIISQNK